MTVPSRTEAAPRAASGREDLERRLIALQPASIEGDTAGACARFASLQNDFDLVGLPLRHALLTTPLDWTLDEKRDARWLHRMCDNFAAIGYRVATCAAGDFGLEDERTRSAIAGTLYFMGQTVKWDICVAPDAPHDLRKPHTLMRLAMEAGRHRDPLRIRVDGAEVACTLEALYFRVLLLARFASGALNSKQIEILDAWLLLWAPALSGVATPPPGTALRADLDSSGGLQRGPRADGGPSLYLPQGPIEEAYRAVVASFHAGRIVPAEGIASELRIEEHVAVLALIRQGLQQWRQATVARAARCPAGHEVRIHVGIGEIMGKAFAPRPPTPAVALATLDGAPRAAARIVRERDTAMGEIYDARHRIVRLIDESDTGLRLEGTVHACGSIATGDLVAVALSAGAPPVLGKVVRSVASRTPGHMIVGLQRLGATARLVEVRQDRARGSNQDLTVAYVPGPDSSGCHDACLVHERTFTERPQFVIPADGRSYTLRLNRARERGRGWVLAGFEVTAARPADFIEIA